MDVQKYLSGFFSGTKDPSLDAMQFFMKEYDNFNTKMNFIHIAGTNGKGSCTEMLTKILINSGYKVGKFISPHLIKYNERISINNEDISDLEMEELIIELKVKIDKYNNSHNTKITLFELETTMALLYFYRKDVDIVVLETGLGGMYDCTNIVNPLVSVITSVGYDHMNILGNTLKEIAEQKAGIIKRNSYTVAFEQNKEIDNVIIEKCNKENNKLYLIENESIKNYKFTNKYQLFDYGNMKNIEVILKGVKQVQNSAICIQTIKILQLLGYCVSEENIRDGIKSVVHKARFETINNNPLIIYDGAHNESAIENFKNTIKACYPVNKKRYVVSILKRKDYKTVLKILLTDVNAEYIFTNGTGDEEYCSKTELESLAKSINPKIHKIFAMNLTDAIKTIYESEDDIANFIIGSFYTYGDVIKIINQFNKKRKSKNDTAKKY